MVKLFRGAVVIHATAYVVAENAEQAKAMLAALPDSAIEVACGEVGDDVIISGERYSPRMTPLSLSPAMSVGVVELEDEDGEAF